MNSLTPYQPNSILVPTSANKDHVSRIKRYVDWLNETGRVWWEVDLEPYRDFLLRVAGNDGNGLSPASTSAHLSTIRTRYRQLMRDRHVRAELMDQAGSMLRGQGIEDTPANRKAVADEIRATIHDAIHADAAPVRVVKKQDKTHLRLTIEQANALIASIDRLRDKAVVSLLLSTGIREFELCLLVVDDLYARMDDGALALEVQEGKGAKGRKIPYGDMVGVLRVVEAWMQEADISSGKVFDFTTRTAQRILQRYPITVEGRLIYARPHDLRRTYARRCYEAGMSVTAIQQNLGHVSQSTTLSYIGELDSSARRPPALFEFE
jgi:integrase